MMLGEILRLHYRAWRYRRRLDPDEISSLLDHLRPGDTALDIGAHKGGYAYWMCRAVGRAGKVICFEPQPALAEYLRRVKQAMRFEQMIVENLGVSSASGELVLHVPGDGPSPGSTLEPGLGGAPHVSYLVGVVSLDDYFRNQPAGRLTFVKCDVEGHELDVFRGGEGLLREHKPVLLFECEERHHMHFTCQDVFDHLASLGYSGSFFSLQGLRPLQEYRPAEHGNPHNQHYVNNFLFRPLPA